MTTSNKGLIYKFAPTRKPVAGTHLAVEDRPIDISALELQQNYLLVKNHYVSFDPYQRGLMRDPAVKSYAPPYETEAPITNSAVSSVVKSKSAKFSPGDLVIITMTCPTEEYSVLPEKLVSQSVRKLENPYGVDVKHFIGALGMPGLTAFSSMREIAKPNPGGTFFVSAASGAVGALTGQIAKKEGMRVIGSVGDDAKLEYIIKELGFDDGFNYKKETPADALKRLAPKGLDVYYDNVGGEHLEAAIEAMNNFGRIVACGMISQYNLPPSERYGVRNLYRVVSNRITFQGFVVMDPDLGPKYFKEHQKVMGQWIADGSFKAKLSLTEGIDNAGEGFVGMLDGNSFGKAVLVIDELK